jgi:hypothetical protein
MCAYSFLVICLRNDTACHWVVSRPLPFGLMQILKKKLYCLHLFQGVLAIFFRTMGAEFTWNYNKKLLLVFEVGPFW